MATAVLWNKMEAAQWFVADMEPVAQWILREAGRWRPTARQQRPRPDSSGGLADLHSSNFCVPVRMRKSDAYMTMGITKASVF